MAEKEVYAVLSTIPEESFSSECPPRDPPDPPYRPYSPLPPLIIERYPDKHDEPEEYYKKLLKKIKRIYRKLFIENKSIDSDDFDITDAIDNFSGDDFSEENMTDKEMDFENVGKDIEYSERDKSDVEMNVTHADQDNISITSHITISSDGYNADFESSNECDDNSDVNVEESNNIDEQDSDDEEMDEENDLKLRHSGINQDDINDYSNNVSVDKEMSDPSQSEDADNCESSPKSPEETAETNKTNETANLNQDGETDVNTQSMDITGELNEEQINEGVTTNNAEIDQEMNEVNNANEMDLIVKERDRVRASEVIVDNDDQVTRDDEMDVSDDEEDDTFNAGIDYRQITTVAQVHVDGSQQDMCRVSPVYETVTSPILPPGVVIAGDVKGDAVLENKDVHSAIYTLYAKYGLDPYYGGLKQSWTILQRFTNDFAIC
ncbi:unnamed protein product [Chrysodeixis includens]|uniref:Uncharacterized protein n=1 Tax=Chrysodeixis includens TaxID=689277 RepID=A0A9N8Q2G4_CHRIL|nr:unnamed protein product [Chrysodeixis includens]